MSDGIRGKADKDEVEKLALEGKNLNLELNLNHLLLVYFIHLFQKELSSSHQDTLIFS